MAKPYFEKLQTLINLLDVKSQVQSACEVKHFFSGAAFYVNNKICVSWSPAGLAFKLTDQEADKYIATGEAIPLKYFAKGHIKKGYALFENPDSSPIEKWMPYFLKAIEEAQRPTNER